MRGMRGKDGGDKSSVSLIIVRDRPVASYRVPIGFLKKRGKNREEKENS